MHDVTRVKELAEAASYLCSASEELAAAGYEGWGGEIRQLLDIIAAEIAWLQELEIKGVVGPA